MFSRINLGETLNNHDSLVANDSKYPSPFKQQLSISIAIKHRNFPNLNVNSLSQFPAEKVHNSLRLGQLLTSPRLSYLVITIAKRNVIYVIDQDKHCHSKHYVSLKGLGMMPFIQALFPPLGITWNHLCFTNNFFFRNSIIICKGEYLINNWERKPWRFLTLDRSLCMPLGLRLF